MTSSASGQDEPNLALWLATRAGKPDEAISRSINTQKKKLGQYPAILTEPAWSITHMYHVKQFCFHSVLSTSACFCAFVLDSLDSYKRKWGDSDFLIFPWFSLDSYRNHYAESGDQAIRW